MDYTRKASIQRKTLWQQIADVLREDIIRGKIKPGERIVEEDIAEKFHVSRGPVREALRHIGEEGFVVYESHKGSTVKTISMKKCRKNILSALPWKFWQSGSLPETSGRNRTGNG